MSLEFNKNKKISLVRDFYSDGDGKIISLTYEEILADTKKWINDLEDGSKQKYFNEQLLKDEITTILEVFEAEKGYTINIVDDYTSITEFCLEQKLQKLSYDILDDSVKRRVINFAEYAEHNNLFAELKELLNDAWRFNFNSDNILDDGSIHQIEDLKLLIKKDFDFHETLDKYNYPKEITYKVVEGKFYWSDEELEKFKNEPGEKILLKLEYYANSIKVGGGEIALTDAYNGKQFDCDSYGLNGEQFYISSEANESKQSFEEALYLLENYALEGMAISIYNKDLERSEVPINTFIDIKNSFIKMYQDNKEEKFNVANTSKNHELDFNNDTEVVYINEDETSKYTAKEILNIAGGSVSYAQNLYDRADWQHIETLADEDRIEDYFSVMALKAKDYLEADSIDYVFEDVDSQGKETQRYRATKGNDSIIVDIYDECYLDIFNEDETINIKITIDDNYDLSKKENLLKHSDNESSLDELNPINTEIKQMKKLINLVKEEKFSEINEIWYGDIGELINDTGRYYPFENSFDDYSKEILSSPKNKEKMVFYFEDILNQIEFKKLLITANTEQVNLGYEQILEMNLEDGNSITNPYFDSSGRFEVEPYTEYREDYSRWLLQIQELLEKCKIYKTKNDIHAIIQVHESSSEKYYSYTYDGSSVSGTFQELKEELLKINAPVEQIEGLIELEKINKIDIIAEAAKITDQQESKTYQ